MGKKKDGKGRIPKRVAGVKLPKELRRKGEALIAQAQSPAGQAAIAQGVSIVAALAASAAKAAADRATVKTTTPPAAEATTPPPPPGDAVAKAVTAGIDAALGRLFVKR